MLKRVYSYAHTKVSGGNGKDDYSAGPWAARVRDAALRLCAGARGRLLDVGCGEGLFLMPFAALAPDCAAYGCEPDAGRIDGLARFAAARRETSRIRLVRCDGRHMPFKKESFDTVVCINVLFNLASLDDVRSLLAEAARVCRAGGKIVCDFRDARNIFLALKYKYAGLYDGTIKDVPLRTYDPIVMRGVLAECGLRVIKEDTIGFPVRFLPAIYIIEASKR